MSMDLVIKIKNLHFSYGGPKILENIEIDIQRNEFIGMVGPNGSGKTTLLKIIMGVLTPDKGSIEVLGKPPFQSVKEIGYMPQFTPFSRDFKSCGWRPKRSSVPASKGASEFLKSASGTWRNGNSRLGPPPLRRTVPGMRFIGGSPTSRATSRSCGAS